MAKLARKDNHQEPEASESDIVSFWLLLLFVAVFFGIAAEEARRPMFSATTATQAPFHSSSVDIHHANTARRHDQNLDLDLDLDSQRPNDTREAKR